MGDVGVFDRGVFDRQTSLDELGIGFDVREDETPADYVTQSSRGVDVTYSLAGESAQGFQAITEVDAGARIEFSRENAFVFSAPSCLEHEIADKSGMKREILRQLEEGGLNWEKNYTVVTDLVEAPSATIIISGSSESAIELRAKADVGREWFTLGGISADVEEAYSRDVQTKVIAAQGITPLFLSLRPKKSLLDRIIGLLSDGSVAAEGEFAPERAYEDEEMADSLFEEVDIEEALGPA